MKIAQDALRRKISEYKTQIHELEELLEFLDPTGDAVLETASQELAKEPFEWSWLVGGVIGRASIGMLVADPHVGKSTLAIQLSMAIANGTNTLGFRISESQKSLYIFAEGARALVAERIKACAGSMGMELPPKLFVQAPCFSDFDVRSSGFRKLMDQSKPKFAVLDALGYFFRGDENSSVEWKEKMIVPLRQLSDKYGTTFCIIHHQTKESPDRKGWQKGRGTSAMFADVDWYWRIETVDGPGNEDKRVLIIDKNKFGASGNGVKLTFNKPGAFFDWRVGV